MFRIIDSNVFEAIGVREIGLTYFSIVFGGFTFGTGITFADFHVSGIQYGRHWAPVMVISRLSECANVHYRRAYLTITKYGVSHSCKLISRKVIGIEPSNIILKIGPR